MNNVMRVLTRTRAMMTGWLEPELRGRGGRTRELYLINYFLFTMAHQPRRHRRSTRCSRNPCKEWTFWSASVFFFCYSFDLAIGRLPQVQHRPSTCMIFSDRRNPCVVGFAFILFSPWYSLFSWYCPELFPSLFASRLIPSVSLSLFDLSYFWPFPLVVLGHD